MRQHGLGIRAPLVRWQAQHEQTCGSHIVHVQELALGQLPPYLENASSWVGSDEWQGRAESAWFKASRQLIHVGFKVAAKMGPRYLEQLKACRESCARNVTGNLFDRHIKPLFL
jgi:kynureninase